MTTEEKEILSGNIMISKWLYGEAEATGLYQIGYKDNKAWYRSNSGMCDSSLENFHNSWNLLMDAISKIAKARVDEFSEEEILIDQIKSSMFQYSYDPMITWFIIVRYIKLKLAV